MKNITFFRFSVFGIWAFTLIFSISVFLFSLIFHEMKYNEIEEPMTMVIGMITPQITVMLAFFFGTDKKKHKNLIEHEQSNSYIAMILSIIYHCVFWIILTISVGLGYLGDTIDENTTAAIKVMSFLSLFALSPIAYLFANSKNTT